MTADAPLITAGVSCYNAQETIGRALRSALSQDWPNIEVVVVDDCSTDGSEELLRELACADSRVRVIRHERNRGIGAVRNSLLAEARGEWLAFFDDDDESDPDRLRRQYQRIVDYERRTGATIVVSHTARRQLFPSGLIHVEPTIGMDVTPGPHGEAVADLILLGRPLPGDGGSCATCSQMARRRVYEALGGFDPSLARGEDTDFNLRAAMQGGHFAGVSDPLVTQYMTFSADKDFQREREQVLHWIAKHREFLVRRSWYEFSLRWFSSKYDLLQGRKARFLGGVLLLMLRYPFKTMQRLCWSWPNRFQYRRLLKAIARENEVGRST